MFNIFNFDSIPCQISYVDSIPCQISMSKVSHVKYLKSKIISYQISQQISSYAKRILSNIIHDGEYHSMSFITRRISSNVKNIMPCRISPHVKVVYFHMFSQTNLSCIKWRCGNVNFKTRDACNKCKEDKDSAQDPSLR